MSLADAPTPPAIVFSGGGARGAYEVGIVSGIVEALGKRPGDPAPFGVFSGTSVGAINAAYLAANTHRGDLGIDVLARLWGELQLRRHLRLDFGSLLGLVPRSRGGERGEASAGCPPTAGRSLLDTRFLERLIAEAIDWEHLHHNVETARTAALFVTALRITSGRTTVFAELAPGRSFQPSRDPRRIARIGRLTHGHVLASAALPMLFPARCVDARYYCDGGLRFNTPIAPAIRVGARRLVIVSLLHPRTHAEFDEIEVPERYPSPLFLLGKLLNALLLDPIVHDLNVLERFNRLVEVLEQELEPPVLQRVRDVLQRSRGAPYHRLETLVFRPSEDIGRMAAEHIREHLPRWDVRGPSQWLLRRVAYAESRWESDLASYLLFDGAFARRLIALGRRDALSQAAAIVDFFGANEP